MLCCIRPPASVQPPKFYNRLVPDVFPDPPWQLDAPITDAIRRKANKLAEYAQNNPQKLPKVRLLRALFGARLPSSQNIMLYISVDITAPGPTLKEVVGAP